MTILHIAYAADWNAAQESGEYRISTRGRTLEQEGFIHCSADRRQADTVTQAFYADVTDPLVLLEIDPTGLDIRYETPEGAHEAFPHLYGPLPTTSVTAVYEHNTR
ncbi:DUF952 domain-containing protein [Nonomuraea africana]|uniref:Uncharacterized protein (DUF952 family) n=1 Tax=Nonomuraea africana TaxID=46171 RepID=A0ABR9KCI8_9ACTN|nr:DUF952 domain-containing protein [Nonomuraea africana]MBE1559729.1 uncharacterized protein (DUF952 family) [Nonomuraea africana]